jgi:hypothetical protein
MRLTVFVSYAREDEKLKNRLLERLRSFETNGMLSIWHDRKLIAGETFDPEITEQLEAADFVLLLISRSFLDSAYCAHENEDGHGPRECARDPGDSRRLRMEQSAFREIQRRAHRRPGGGVMAG